MWEEILKAISMVYLPSTLKFIFGPLGGYAAGLHLITTIVCTVGGAMSSVVAFTYFGNWIRNSLLKKFFHRPPKPMNERSAFVRYFMKYELGGIAFLTPLILTPIGGALLAVSFGAPKEKIIFYMFLSTTFWAVVFSVSIYFSEMRCYRIL
jgi:accessory gene regulator protein AgrB